MVKRLMRAGLLALVVGAPCAQGCGSSDPAAYGGLESALAGHPDEPTRQAIQVLAGVLNAEEWGYLTYAQWPQDGGKAALHDPVLRKAMNALASAGGVTLQAVPAGGWSIHTQGLGGPGYQPQGIFPPVQQITLPDGANHATALMQFANGLSFAGTPGAAAAWAALLAGLIAADPSTPLPDPTIPADGVVAGCGKCRMETVGPCAPTCSATDFCCSGVIDFNTGKLEDPSHEGTSTCHDFDSCRGMVPPPMFGTTGTIGSGAGGSGSSGGSGGGGTGSNPCFVGPGVTSEWEQACQMLDATKPSFYNCLDPSSGPGLGAPQLPDGSDPSTVCIPFTDASGANTPLGMVVGCDPGDPGYTQCWCCPQ